MRPKTKKLGNLTIRCYDSAVDSEKLVNALKGADVLPHLGRGGIKLIEIDGKKLVSRKYLHGGLLRFLTRDRFISEKRCRTEVDTINYLRGKGFPVVTPFATVTEKQFAAYRLNLLTVFEQGSVSLLEYLKTVPHRERMSMISRFIHLFCRLQNHGVYHPDLHIGNVLVTSTQNLMFLDFDRAENRTLNRRDRNLMLWRLWRHINKMERLGGLKLDDKEKNYLLKTYGRVSGADPTTVLARKARMALCFHKVGSVLESLLYRRGTR